MYNPIKNFTEWRARRLETLQKEFGFDKEPKMTCMSEIDQPFTVEGFDFAKAKNDLHGSLYYCDEVNDLYYSSYGRYGYMPIQFFLISLCEEDLPLFGFQGQFNLFFAVMNCSSVWYRDENGHRHIKPAVKLNLESACSKLYSTEVKESNYRFLWGYEFMKAFNLIHPAPHMSFLASSDEAVAFYETEEVSKSIKFIRARYDLLIRKAKDTFSGYGFEFDGDLVKVDGYIPIQRVSGGY